MWDLGNTTTWIRGRHTFYFGANYRKWSLQRDLANDFLGQFTFSGFFTGNKTKDNAVADMLLGYFSTRLRFNRPDSAWPDGREILESLISSTLRHTSRTISRSAHV